jgi:hypothetical protein
MQDFLLHTGHAYGSNFNDPEWQRIAYSTEGFTAAAATRGPARHALSQNPSLGLKCSGFRFCLSLRNGFRVWNSGCCGDPKACQLP